MKRERVHSTAKTTRPAFEGVCLRKRLFAKIDAGRKRPVVWVCGPPGAGKTILASSYVETRGLPCLWYQADRGDSDLATFFYYMRGAAAGARGGNGAALPLFTPEYAHGPGVFSKRFFEGLFSGMKNPSCLVIDNCHEAAPGSAFCDALAEGISAMPEGTSAIILSRSAPPASFSKLAAAETLMAQGKTQRAAEYLQAGLAADDCAERLCQKLLEIHSCEGRAAEAVVVFEKLKRSLSARYGVKPSPATKAAVRRLTGDRVDM